MNKKLVLCALTAAIGVGAGYFAANYSKSHLSGAYYGKTASVNQSKLGLIVNQPNVKVEFKSNQEYDLLYITSKLVGFSSGGEYLVTGNSISLQENRHDKIVPDRDLEFYEKVMISGGAILSNDSMDYLTIGENEFLLISEYGMLHFCKGNPCEELEAYSNASD